LDSFSIILPVLITVIVAVPREMVREVLFVIILCCPFSIHALFA